MSTESIIGITSGIIGIIGGVYGGYCWLNKKIKKRPISEVFKQLTDKNIQDYKHREYLKKLNSYPLFHNKIKENYIQKFTLGKRGKEDVLLDICYSNNIEPTDDICKELLGYSSPSLLAKYQEMRQSINMESTSTRVEPIIMNEPKEKLVQLPGEQIVHMSELLKEKYPDTCDRLIRILEKHNVKYSFLKGTEDIWCRDYMPVQNVSGKLIQFKYDPSYLREKKEWEDSRSDLDKVRKLNGIEAELSDINLDGGNVLICDGRAIISDRVYSENPKLDKEEIKNKLSKLLECEIVIIPAQKSDMTGHADGMVRFVDRNTILGNNLEKEYKYWREGMERVIAEFNLKYINVPFFEPKDPKHPLSSIGVYVNYLEVNNLIVLPVFGRDEDQQAIDVIQKAFPNKTIETIDYNEVALEGGLVNCTTWVINVSPNIN